jgi:hypothetical protein
MKNLTVKLKKVSRTVAAYRSDRRQLGKPTETTTIGTDPTNTTFTIVTTSSHLVWN